MDIRSYEDRDLRDLYAISLATGYRGGDASALHADPEMIGHIYSAPYGALEPALVLVATDEEGVAGFALGALDTVAWEERLEREWWPALRSRYPDPTGAETSWSDDQRRVHMIHHPERASGAIVAAYPTHLHLNLLPRAQGRGIGMRLLSAWLDLAKPVGVHVTVNRANDRALRFWAKAGFEVLDQEGAATRTVSMGKRWLRRG